MRKLVLERQNNLFTVTSGYEAEPGFKPEVPVPEAEPLILS